MAFGTRERNIIPWVVAGSVSLSSIWVGRKLVSNFKVVNPDIAMRQAGCVNIVQVAF